MVIWKMQYGSGDYTWQDCGTCDVKLTDNTVTLCNIVSDRIRPKKEGGKIMCKREWASEILDEDYKDGEFYWYYGKRGIPYKFTRNG